jgi:23S rRNA (guanosine2251-2'-O)-methyltransferase
MKKILSILAFCAVCIFIILQQAQKTENEWEETFPEGKITYLIDCKKGNDMPTKEADKFISSSIMEGMTSVRAVFAGEEYGVNDRKIEKILFDKAKTKSKFRELGFLRAKGEEKGFTVELSSAEEIDALAIGQSHGGVLAYTSDRTIKNITECEIKENGFYVFLQGIEDPYNFGYAMRSLYACGCDGVILTPRNWMNAAGVVCRSSAGASELLPLYTAEPEAAAERMKALGYKMICAGIRE